MDFSEQQKAFIKDLVATLNDTISENTNKLNKCIKDNLK